jgi:hypothetical protein
MDKINIYINSKNRKENENSNKFTVKIPNNLLRLNRDEYFTLNVNGFYCYNSWFNCIDGFNNMFQIVICNVNDEITSIFEYRLQDGNPNVNDVRTNLNNLLLNKVVVSYDKIKNKFIYKRTLPITITNFKMYIKIINSEDFLGFYKSDREQLILLPYLNNIYCNSIVNISGDEAIIIKISGDCILAGNTVDNFGDIDYQPSNIIFMKPIDVASNGLLKYNNEDGGDSFQYRLANIEQITSFELTVHNQDDEFIPSFSDYILLLQFIRHSTQEDKTHTILESILDYIKQMYLIISQIVYPPSY